MHIEELCQFNKAFYIPGSGDQVLCFSCDGGLKNWDPTDEPWTEHAKWFDQCHYLNLKKSPEFIRLAKLAISQPEEDQEDRHEQEAISNDVDEETTNNHMTEETTEAKPRQPLLESDSGYSSIEDTETSETTSVPSTKELLEENERLKDEKACRVCLTNERNVLFLPCRHLVTCPDCAVVVEKCPVCRSQIECTVKVFKS